MSRKLVLSIIVILIITNIATLFVWSMDKRVLLDDDREISSDEWVAVIGDEEILYEDWMNSLRASYGKDFLKGMIDRSIVEQLAEREDIVVQDKVIERELSLLISMQGVMSENELERQKDVWRQDITHRYKLEALLTDDIFIPDEEALAYYEMYQNQYDFTETMQLSHIVVENFDKAEKVMAELDEGATFNLLAQEYSIDEETSDRGGYLGFLTRTSSLIDENYFYVADNLERNSYSAPFQSGVGVSIIYCHLKLPSITFAYEEVEQYIKNELAIGQEDSPIVVDQLWDKLDVEWIYEQ